MKKLFFLLVILPAFSFGQTSETNPQIDTVRATLLLRQGKNYDKKGEGYAILQRTDSCRCKPLGYLNLLKKPFPAKYTVISHIVIPPVKRKK
jgi:hypothetical protein